MAGQPFPPSGSDAAGGTADRLARIAAQARTAADDPSAYGRIRSVAGTVVRADLPGAEIGELCDIVDFRIGTIDVAEVIGIDGDDAILAPYAGTAGLSIRIEVARRHRRAEVEVGAHLLGSVMDGRGRVIGGRRKAPIPGETAWQALSGEPPPALQRQTISRSMPVGIRAIDGLLTLGEGQRVGLYGSPGAGKSTLVGAVVDHAAADVAVVALIGERGREVTEFAERHLSGPQGNRLVVVAATSDRPALERWQAALVATSVAEHFRDRGARVLLVVDSVTRLARALREIGLAAGEPPVRRGFPPSVFTQLPRLFERAGPGKTGTITALYTVLVEGDIGEDPVAEETRSLLDGHLVLSTDLLSAGWYPALDILASRSRTMAAVVTGEHRRAADRIRTLMARYGELEFLIRLGEYQRGRDALDDAAVASWPGISTLLRQDIATPAAFLDTVAQLRRIAAESET